MTSRRATLEIVESIRGLARDLWICPPDYLAGFTVQRFSKSQVVRAGKLVAATHTDVSEELVAAFRVAHQWREAHIMPLRGVRGELTRRAHKVERWSVTAGRLKRLQSLRRKLKRGNITLYQIQDIAGCRAIMSSMSAVRELQRRYEGGGTKHEIIDNDDYIANPKPDGYRSLHLVLKYRGDVEETAGNRLVVEVQIRTGLQHAWATAVEAVGLVRRENLKSGEGSADWLRLFQLMAGEIAVAENCALPATVPSDRAVRRAELKALDKKLGAVKSLEGYNAAIRHAENYTNISGYSYLIKYNIDNQTVSVEPFSQFRRAAAQYFEREQSSSSARENIVFVEVDGVDELKAAYPSYFLDVRLFTEQLKAAVFENVPFVDRLSPRRPQPPDKPPRKRKWGDLSFLRDYRLK